MEKKRCRYDDVNGDNEGGEGGEGGGENTKSVFDKKTDAASALSYFHYYGMLMHQQNLLQDYTRTGCYQKAIFTNYVDFNGKVVLDVGAGSGVLSIFAAKAGARRVFSVEASDMSKHCERLVYANHLEDIITVIPSRIEDIDSLPPVDVIVSEPMGVLLVSERMLESYIYARRWLRDPNKGMMMPSEGRIYVAPFTDETLYIEQKQRTEFWKQRNFFGIDVSCMGEQATHDIFSQPVVDQLSPECLLASPAIHRVDFLTVTDEDLATIIIPVEFSVSRPANLHGLAAWFDVAFCGSSARIILSTAPDVPLTHWYQVRCLLEEPIFVQPHQDVTGQLELRVHNRQSYNITLKLTNPNNGIVHENMLDLKEPFYRSTMVAPTPITIYGNDEDITTADEVNRR